MKLKVCGMKFRPNIELILGLEPDFLGFIFYEKSPRNVGDSLRPEFVRFIDSVKKVGVFVNADKAFMEEKVESFGLDMVQLHGNESPETCLSLRRSGLEVIKVFSVGEEMDFSQLLPYQSVVDYFLFDTKGKKPGGNGVTFDWDILSDYDLNIPFFLSGGIGPEEIPAICRFSHPHFFALDINSRFEVRPGEKDPEKIKKLKTEISHV
ncbi:MAG: phosphoribosylanthranilate isomerase [Bacteroidia bacterium]|nr:phosphoribosylanthranilate isomerase [Bacteroidia bacterium]